jgi:hypothetical protein
MLIFEWHMDDDGGPSCDRGGLAFTLAEEEVERDHVVQECFQAPSVEIVPSCPGDERTTHVTCGVSAYP